MALKGRDEAAIVNEDAPGVDIRSEALAPLRMAIAAGYNPQAAAAWANLDRVAWQKIAALAEDWGLLPLWYQAAKERLDVPSDQLACWRRATLENQARNAFITHHLTVVLAALEERGFTGILLKGAALLAQVYQRSEQRVLGDVDIWFPADQLFEVRRLLEQQGFALSNPLLVDDRLGWFNHAVAYRNPSQSDWELEIHGRLLRYPHYQDRPRFQDWLATSVSLRLENSAVRVLAPEEHLLYLCAHAYYQHGSPHAHPRVAPDLGFFFKAYPAVNVDRLISLARGCHMSAGLHKVLDWVHRYWFVAVPGDLMSAVQQLKPTTQELRLYRWQRRALAKQWGWLWSLPGIARKRQYLAALLWPPRDYMHAFWQGRPRETLIGSHWRRWWSLIKGQSSPNN